MLMYNFFINKCNLHLTTKKVNRGDEYPKMLYNTTINIMNKYEICVKLEQKT